jgi:Fe2+ or Zn2+ uptake regulation protein
MTFKTEKGTNRERRATAVQERDRIGFGLKILRNDAVRITSARRFLLERLAANPAPVSVKELIQSTDDVSEFHPVTIYRAVKLFERIGLVRSVRLSGSDTIYSMAIDVGHGNYLVCRECHWIQGLPQLGDVVEIESRLAVQYGFENINHMLEFSGVCETCDSSSDRAGSSAWTSENL